MNRKCSVLLFLVCLAPAPVWADVRIHPPEPVRGTLLLCGGGKLPDTILDRFVQLAGGDDAKIVVIPTASAVADTPKAGELLDTWQSRGPADVVLVHTRSREEADEPSFVEPIRKATGVWFSGGNQSRIASAYCDTLVERELTALLQRGGVIGGTSAGAAIQSRVMIRGGNPQASVGRGLDLMPGAVVDQHFLRRNRVNRLLGVLAQNPGLVGYGIDESTAMLVHGRRIEVLGESYVTVCLAPSVNRPLRAEVLHEGRPADLIALSRAAIARCGPRFPPKQPPEPEVKSGTLLIVGGGALTKEMIGTFVDSAGGPDAPIVVIPTASGRTPPGGSRMVATFRRAGATDVRVVHAPDRTGAEDPALLDSLRRAKGIWFGGGRQWRLVDAYLDTKAHQLFHDVLARGGVIGGSSAGASIQADYLVRGNPLGNLEMMAEGYERGLGFLPGAAIDQHFAQRKRFKDMSQLKRVFPQLLGLGIDESTAVVVRGHRMKVIGKNNVAVYDRHMPADGNGQDYKSLMSGTTYDLKLRTVVSQPEPEPVNP